MTQALPFGCPIFSESAQAATTMHRGPIEAMPPIHRRLLLLVRLKHFLLSCPCPPSRRPVRLETTPEFETAAGAATASSGHNPKGDLSEGASATGPTFSWASTSSVLDRVREEKDPVAELRVEDRMRAAVSKVRSIDPSFWLSVCSCSLCEATFMVVFSCFAESVSRFLSRFLGAVWRSAANQ